VKKILFVTLSNIGDAVLTTPTLETLHQHYPDATIDLVCDPRSAQLFEYCPYRGQIFIKNKQDGLAGYLTLTRQIRSQHYDLAVDLKTDFLLWCARAKIKLAKVDRTDIHSAIKHHMALDQLHLHAKVPAAKIWLSDDEAQSVAQQMQDKKSILAFGIGANFEGKIWPVAQYARLTYLLADKFDCVMLLGNAKDGERSQAFKKMVNLPVLDFCGQLNLTQSCSALSHAHYFVGNDSGLGHMAAALGTPTFTIFGPGEPLRYKPWSDQAHYYQDPARNILNIEADMIYEMIQLPPV
jgi:heptosyltransferase-3